MSGQMWDIWVFVWSADNTFYTVLELEKVRDAVTVHESRSLYTLLYQCLSSVRQLPRWPSYNHSPTTIGQTLCRIVV